ncbi:hypothetical protein EDD16DRAFT_1517700 [Pisolithus croceorrhizus]|nr:hypothetical protein EDD16DRAFT_1517700 [Pisolithus croceorrhizus]
MAGAPSMLPALRLFTRHLSQRGPLVVSRIWSPGCEKRVDSDLGNVQNLYKMSGYLTTDRINCKRNFHYLSFWREERVRVFRSFEARHARGNTSDTSSEAIQEAPASDKQTGWECLELINCGTAPDHFKDKHGIINLAREVELGVFIRKIRREIKLAWRARVNPSVCCLVISIIADRDFSASKRTNVIGLPRVERYLLFLPFAAIHVAPSVAKWVVLTLASNPSSSPSSSLSRSDSVYTAQSEKPFTPKSICCTLRPYPRCYTKTCYPPKWTLSWSSRDVELDALSSSELNFKFVKIGWMLYMGLAGSPLVHAAEGASIVYMRYIRGRVAALPSQPSPRGSDRGLTRGSRRTIVIAGIAALLVLTGLWVVSREPTFALSSVVQQYQDILMGTCVSRL